MSSNNAPILQVAAKAVIVNDNGQVLIVRESAQCIGNTMTGKYGVPGGRLDPGESFEDALHREVMEEVGLRVEPIKPIGIGEWNPTINGIPHQIVAIFMLCKPLTDTVALSDEHDKFAWVSKKDLKNYKIMSDEQHIFENLFLISQ